MLLFLNQNIKQNKTKQNKTKQNKKQKRKTNLKKYTEKVTNILLIVL